MVLCAIYGLPAVASDTGAILSFVFIPCVMIIGCNWQQLNMFCNNKIMSHITGLTTPFFFWHIPVWNVFRSVYDPLIGHMNGRVALPVYFICLTLVAELSNVVFGRVEVGLKKDLLEGG